MFDGLKQVLFTDSVVAGEAAGYAMGLILLEPETAGVASADEMLAYARETQLEQIICGFLLRRFVARYLFDRYSLMISL